MKAITVKKTLFAMVATYTASLYAIDGTGSLTSGSITRTYAYHAPGASVAANLPVMIVMHGDGGSGSGIKGYSGFDAVADANNFIAVYPDAVASSWNRYIDDVAGDAGLGNPNAPDDVLFISDLIDHLCSTYHINPDKVYATGHSAGGFMAYNLAVKLTNKIAAFAPVSGSMWGDAGYINNYFTNNYTQVPILHIHGDADATVDYPDPNNMPDSWGEWPLPAFSSPNCGHDTYISQTDVIAGVKNLIFCDASGKEVILTRIVGGGHGWPAVAGFSAALHIWNFCNAYSLNTGINCSTGLGSEEEKTWILNLYPNPASHWVNIQGDWKENTRLEVYNITGQCVMHTLLTQPLFSVEGFATGIYQIRLIQGNTTYTQKLIVP